MMKGWTPLCLLLAFSTTAHGQTPGGVDLQGGLAAGYDSNIYLETTALPGDVENASGGGLALDISADLRLGLARSHHLLLTYGADLHQYLLTGGGHETSLRHGAGATYGIAPLAGFRLWASAELEHLVLAQQGDAGWLSGTGRLRATRALCGWARAALGYSVEHSWFGALSSVSRQLGHGPELSLGLRVAPGLLVEPFYALSVETGDGGDLRGTQHQTGLWLWWRPDWLPVVFRLGYKLAVVDQTLVTTEENPAGKTVSSVVERDDLIHLWGEEARLRALSWLEVFVRHESVLGSGDGDEAYARHQVFAGVRAQLGWHREPPSPPPQRGLALEYRDDHAQAVSVVGSFNAWNPGANRLQKGPGGLWQGTVRLPAGRHVYMLWVDGKTVPPPGCETWIRDGYGGKNCVIDRILDD